MDCSGLQVLPICYQDVFFFKHALLLMRSVRNATFANVVMFHGVAKEQQDRMYPVSLAARAIQEKKSFHWERCPCTIRCVCCLFTPSLILLAVRNEPFGRSSETEELLPARPQAEKCFKPSPDLELTLPCSLWSGL